MEGAAPDQNQAELLDPFRNETATAQLSRLYNVDNFEWSAASATGTCIAAYRFPETLFAQSSVQRFLEHFKYFRGSVRLSLRLNSTKFHFGTLLVSWLPYYDPCGTGLKDYAAVNNIEQAKFGSIYTMSNNPSHLMSACAQDPLEFEIPCRMPGAWLDIDDYIGETNFDVLRGILGCVVVRVVTPLGLLGSTVTPTIDCAVHASFVEPRLAGFTNMTGRTYPAYVVNQSSNVVAEGRTKRSEAREKSATGLLSGIAEATEGIARNLTPVGGGVVATAARFLGAGLRSLGLNKPGSIKAPETMIPVVTSDVCNVDGLEDTMPLSLRRDNQISNDWKLLGLAPDEDDVRHISTRLNLVKVESFDGTSISGTSVFNWLVTPMYTTSEIVGVAPNRYRKYYMNHHSWLGTNFMWWRGSMKYRLRFVCSQFTTARVRISWYPTSEGLPSPNVDSGDIISQVVDICGDTEVEFSVPYLQPEYWKIALFPTPAGNGIADGWRTQTNGMVYVTVVNPVKTAEDTASSIIYAVLMQTIGEDMQYSGTTQNFTHSIQRDRITVESRSVCIPSSQLHGVGPFAPIQGGKGVADSGICMGDCVENIKELMHRYSYMDTYNSTNSYNVGTTVANPFQNNISPSDASLMAKLAAMYLFVRGKIRYKLYSEVPFSVTSNLITFSGNTGVNAPDVSDYVFSAGSAFGAVATSRIVSVEIPYYVPWAWTLPATSSSGTTTTGARYNSKQRIQLSGTVASVQAFVAAGDDFQVGVLCAPPHMFGKWTLPTMGETGEYPF